jgi:hypothetical protein
MTSPSVPSHCPSPLRSFPLSLRKLSSIPRTNLPKGGDFCEVVDFDTLVAEYIVGHVASFWRFRQELLTVHDSIAGTHRHVDHDIPRQGFDLTRAGKVTALIIFCRRFSDHVFPRNLRRYLHRVRPAAVAVDRFDGSGMSSSASSPGPLTNLDLQKQGTQSCMQNHRLAPALPTARHCAPRSRALFLHSFLPSNPFLPGDAPATATNHERLERLRAGAGWQAE